MSCRYMLFTTFILLIETLLSLVSNVNITDRAGRTSLHHAAYNGHAEVSIFFFKLSLYFWENKNRYCSMRVIACYLK